jgi:hypothetical protein
VGIDPARYHPSRTVAAAGRLVGRDRSVWQASDLLLAKRLFGLRGGVVAAHAERQRDVGWEALERTAPNARQPIGAAELA